MLDIINAPQGFADAQTEMKANHIVSRLWAHDHRIWRDDPTEITNRLGWLHLPETMPARVDEIRHFAAEIRDEFEDVLLLGMGGSSLAPETLSLAIKPSDSFPSLHVLDSTHPDAIRDVEQAIDLRKTLVLVATKSGTTTETLSLFRYMWNRLADSVGSDTPRRFAAITDPGSPLVALAASHGFRRVFENNPELGGRYSALSHFGLVPASLVGVDVRAILRHAQTVARACTAEDRIEENPAATLGALLGVSAGIGRDKVTLILSDAIASLGDWIEQLIAESTGKEGRGILPIVGEPLVSPHEYGDDRLFVHVRLAGDGSQDDAVDSIAAAGHPVARIDISEPAALGGQFFLWEMATAIAGSILQINPFDQPNVESSKALSRAMVEAYNESGRLPELPTDAPTPDLVRTFLVNASARSYVALQAYVPPRAATARALSQLREAVRDASDGRATTVGFGPRFLHSTGQLHKGDAGLGLFIQLIAQPTEDLDIPDAAGSSDSSLSFGTLINAQAAGDRQALLNAKRPVLTLRLEAGREPEEIRSLADRLIS